MTKQFKRGKFKFEKGCAFVNNIKKEFQQRTSDFSRNVFTLIWDRWADV